MKICKKTLSKTGAALAAVALLGTAGVSAQEADFEDTGYEEEVSSSDDFGFDDDFGGDFGSFGESSSSSLTVSGSASTEFRGYVDPRQNNISVPADITTDASVGATLGLNYAGTMADADVQLKFDEATISEYPQDVIDELKITGYFFDRNLVLDVGKMKTVWGKGDKLHVLDNFNADDYTDFIIPDYLDRRISTPMVRASYSLPWNAINIEGIYTPFMPTDRYASSGAWVPGEVTTLTNLVTEALVTNQTIAMGTTISYPALVQNVQELQSYQNGALYPDTNTLKYGQAGIRATGTFGPVDLGLSYYYGHYKKVSANLGDYLVSVGTRAVNHATKYALPSLAYDMKNTFGLEAATVIWHFNVRGEFAYNLTEDTAGDNPWVHNNSIGWVAGFDIDLPFWNANLNVQDLGSCTLNYGSKIKGSAYEKYDVDYNAGYATNNKLAVNFTTSFMNDRILPEITVMWGIERGDLVVMPKLAYKPADGLTLTASGMYIWCRDSDSEFAAWENNSFVNLGASIEF